METLVINVIITFWLLFFSAMAILPFVVETREARRTPLDLIDDQIISIKPVADGDTPPRPLTPSASVASHGPDQRDAA
jgi:hypothetical protein